MSTRPLHILDQQPGKSGRLDRVAAVIPAYNEVGKIGEVLRKIPPDVVDAVIVVDDCSTDETSAEARAGGAIVLRHQQNLGVGAGIRTGIDYARSNGFQIVTILSGDDQHDPKELPDVLRPLLEGGADFVQGSRRADGLRTVSMPLFRRFTTWAYAFVFRRLTGSRCTDGTNGFRAFRLSIFEDSRINLWQEWLNRYELEPYLLFQAVKTGKKLVEVPITIVYHERGTTKMRAVRDWWRILRPLVFLSLHIRR